MSLYHVGKGGQIYKLARRGRINHLRCIAYTSLCSPESILGCREYYDDLSPEGG
jgi:hypothetical protein